jgi:hypothetical protein
MGDYAGICPCDDGSARQARDWYMRLDAELAQASHTQSAYVDDATPATRANILSALTNATAQVVLYFGHGTSDEWTRKGTVTVDRTNVSAANGKAVVSVSCKSGRNLGPDAVNNSGVKAWLGFTITVPVISPHSGSDPIGDAIVKGLATLANGTMASVRTALETELRQVTADYDTGGRFHNHPNALLGYFASGWLADNLSLSGTTALTPLAATQKQPSGPRVTQSPRTTYSYLLRMSGDEESNTRFLARLKSFPTVTGQAYFDERSDDGEVQIAAWSSEPLAEILSSIASESSTSVLSYDSLKTTAWPSRQRPLT